jgi:hypothetical protein
LLVHRDLVNDLGHLEDFRQIGAPRVSARATNA